MTFCIRHEDPHGAGRYFFSLCEVILQHNLMFHLREVIQSTGVVDRGCVVAISISPATVVIVVDVFVVEWMIKQSNSGLRREAT